MKSQKVYTREERKKRLHLPPQALKLTLRICFSKYYFKRFRLHKKYGFTVEAEIKLILEGDEALPNRSFITPGFKDKSKCATICMAGSSSIHIVTSSANNEQQYHEKITKRL
jgi:hypothetical protein